MLERGFDTGTANLTFLVILGICVIGYLIILATLANIIVPWLMKKLPDKEKPTPIIVTQDDISDKKRRNIGTIDRRYMTERR